MESLVLDGKTYVKASKAARDLGYATDYVGQLCRSGKVDAHLIGRTWYVYQDDLQTHRVEKKRMSRIKAREQAHKSIEAHRIKVNTTHNTYKNIDIQYEEDANELIPPTRKLSVIPAYERILKEKEVVDSNPTYINKGEKILMSGPISVVDVTDGPVDDETVFLTSILDRKRKPTVAKEELEPEEDDEYTEDTQLDKQIEVDSDGEEEHIVSFNQKLEAYEVETGNEPPFTEVSKEEIINGKELFDSVEEESSILPYVIVILLILSFVSLSTCISLTLQYTIDYTPHFSEAYTLDLEAITNLIKLKI